MRLCYIHNIAMPGPEANTVNVAKMCAAFAANGCTVTLAALTKGDTPTVGKRLRAHYGLNGDFEVRPLPRAAARPTIAGLVGVAMARRLGADLVYTRAPHAAWAACLAGVPTILEAHTDLDAFSALGRRAFRQALRHPKLVQLVVISEALRRRLRQEGARRIIVAHDGADPGVEPPAEAAPSGRLRAGFVGRLYRGKGLELIAALAPLCTWAEFHIVGGDAADAARLVTAPLAENIILHGALPHADAQRRIASFDVALAPYQRAVTVADGRTDAARWMSPLKLFEYMAAGKAMLASDLPVLREIVSDGETALLLPPDQPEAWARALARLRDDVALRAGLGARARALLLARYTWTQRARRILEDSGLTPAASLPPQCGRAAASAR